MAVKKYLDLNGLTAYNNKLKTVYPKNIAYGDYTPTGGSTARKGFHYDLDMESSGSQSTYTYTLVDLDTLKTDLDIPTSANAFGNVKVGNITIAADTTSDTIEIIAGDKIALTPDTTNSTLTIGVSNVPTESGSAGSKTSTAGEGEFVLGSDTNLAKAKTAIQGVNIGGTVTSGVVSGGTDATITNDKKAVFTTLPANTLSGTTSTSLVLGDGVTATTQSQGNNSTKVATTAYVDTAINNLPEPMIFSGGVAVVETVTGTSPNYTYSYSVTLPNDITTLVEGYTFKVTSASGSYPTGYDGSRVAVGDTFIVATGGTISSHVTTDTTWTIIPSGDEPSGTVTEVATGIGLTGGPINTSGTIKVDIQSETAFGADAETESTPSDVITHIYPVLTDNSGDLAVHVPLEDLEDTDNRLIAEQAYTIYPNPPYQSSTTNYVTLKYDYAENPDNSFDLNNCMVTEFGIIYCNDGTITDINKLTLDNVDGTHIKKIIGFNKYDVQDLGYGVTAIGYTNVSYDTHIYYNEGTGNSYVLNKSTSTWDAKTWTGLTDISGTHIWTDGENIYYSSGGPNYVLNKATSTWTRKTWNGLTSFSGFYIWTDDTDIYYSYNANQYVLDKDTSTWTAKTWTGLTDYSGSDIWTDGENIYYSRGASQYVLDKATSTWSEKTWNGLTNFGGNYIWTDGENIYCSFSSTQYVLDKATSTWEAKTWNGYTDVDGQIIWTDGENIYHSYSTDQYVLDKSTSTWLAKTWTGYTNVDGFYIWIDNTNNNTITIYSNNIGGTYSYLPNSSSAPSTTLSEAQITSKLGTITDTKNTAGATSNANKLYLVGATEQSANPQTYSQANVYATAGKLYSNAKEVVNLSDSQALTNKTYNGYTLAGACAKSVTTSITYGSTSTNLPTVKAVSDFVDKTDFIERTGSIYIDSTPDAVSSVITITNSTYLPRKGGTIVVKFTYDVLAGTSLKIGSSNTAYPIYLNGTAIESGVIIAGTTVTMTFTGSAYEITVIPITNSAIDSLFTS